MSAFPSDRRFRRALTPALAATGLVVAAVAMPVPSATAIETGAHSGQPRPMQVRLTADDDSGVRATSVPLDGRSLARRMATQTFTMVAVTWRDADVDPGDVRIQVQRDGRWRAPIPLEELHDGPDSVEVTDDTPGMDGPGDISASRQRASREGTDLAWVGSSEGVRVLLADKPGYGRDAGDDLPHGLRLELIDARPLGTDQPMVTWSRSRGDDEVPKPDLYSRKDWGADPDWRDGTLRVNKTIRQVHVHHTAGGNGYSRGDVPGILRGIYRYHTKTLKWADIGYNFLVDRFGRTWVGRAGGAGKPVQGAHTLGFNKGSVGVAVLGNYDSKRAPDRAVRAIVDLAAWKLDKYDRDPEGKIRVTSTGSDLYPEGDKVRLNVIDGHRDTNETACPGAKLYKRLPEIRRKTAKRIKAF